MPIGSSVGYRIETAGLTAAAVGDLIDGEVADKIEYDYFLDLGTGLSEDDQVAAFDAAKAAVASVIAAKGQAKIALMGKATWITIAKVPEAMDNITFVKTGQFVFELPVGMETGDATASDAYFRGKRCSITGEHGILLISESTGAAIRRKVWEGDGQGVCENWWVDNVSPDDAAYPTAYFNSTGAGDTIRNIHKIQSKLDLTISSVTDSGGDARFHFSGSPDLGSLVPGDYLIVAGTTSYNGQHVVTAVSDGGDYIQTSTAFVADETGTAEYWSYGNGFQRTFAIAKNATSGIEGVGLTVENCSWGWFLHIAGADSVINGCKAFNNIEIQAGADSTIVTASESFSTAILDADDVIVNGLKLGGPIHINGSQNILSNILREGGGGVTVNGSACRITNMQQPGVTDDLDINADFFKGVNIEANRIITLDANQCAFENMETLTAQLTGQQHELELRIVPGGVFTNQFSGLEDCDIDLFFGGQNFSSEWGLPPDGWGKDNRYRIRMTKQTSTWEDRILIRMDIGDYSSIIDGETFDLIDDIQSLTFEFDVAGNGVGGGNVAIDISTATSNQDVVDAMKAAIDASDVAYRIPEGETANQFHIQSTRFLAVQISADTDVIDISGVPELSLDFTRHQDGVLVLYDCEDCTFVVDVFGDPGTSSDEVENTICAVLPTVVGGSVKVNVMEQAATDEPRVICLASKVIYEIANRLGQVQVGYELGSDGYFQLSGGGGTDEISDITVDGVSIMSGAEVWDTNLTTTLQNVIDNINAHTSAPNYTAEFYPGIADTVRVREVTNAGSTALAIVVTVTDNGGGLTLEFERDVKGGADLGVTKAIVTAAAAKLHFADGASNKSSDNIVPAAVLDEEATGNVGANSIVQAY